MSRVLALFVNLGSINELGMSEDEDDKDVDDSDHQEVTLGKRQNGTTDSNYDDHDSSRGDDNDDDDDDDDDDDNSDNEKDSAHLASDNKSEEDYNSFATEDDLDTSGNEDNDGVDDDLGDDAIQSFSATSLKEDLEKGKAAKNQLSKFLMK